MAFDPSAKVQDRQRRLTAFMDEHIYPNEQRRVEEAETLGPWKVHPVIEELKPKARAAGLWNLFLPESAHGAGLTNLEYAPLCETWAAASWRPRSSTAARRTPATWCWRATARRSTRNAD